MRDIYKIKLFLQFEAKNFFSFVKKFFRITKRRNNSPFSHFAKGIAIVVFIVGLYSVINSEDLNTILPINASADEEVLADKNPSQPLQDNTQTLLFLSARLYNSVDSPRPQDKKVPAIGGAVDPTLSTSSDTALLWSSFIVIPETPEQERDEIITYVVKPGNTPSGIASSFGLSLNTLLWANDLRSQNLIRPGDELIILPVDGLIYEVRYGDTISSIASAHKAKAGDILKYNEISSTAYIIEGQTLIIPGGVEPAPTRRAVPRYASSLQNLDSYFVKPTEGYISQGLHRTNAIDIAGGCWQPIYAAASGNVGIAIGNGLWNGGFGSYVTIDHPNGVKTLYSHMIKVTTYSGAYVAQGQLIGYTGSTGRSTGCHLHWEVRGARNPMAY